VPDQVGDELYRGAAVGHDRHERVPQIPRRPRSSDPGAGDHGTELVTDDLRLRFGVVTGSEDIGDPRRSPAVLGPPLLLPLLVFGEDLDGDVGEGESPLAAGGLGLSVLADRMPDLDMAVGSRHARCRTSRSAPWSG
jgi:hypothetical protein